VIFQNFEVIAFHSWFRTDTRWRFNVFYFNESTKNVSNTCFNLLL